MFIIPGKPHRKVSLLGLCQRARVVEDIQHSAWNRKSVVVPLDALFCGILDLRVVKEEGDSVGLVVGIVYWGTPGAYEGDSVVAVTSVR
jgi:hypothetical protein